ncbi:MAG: hypothetical protein FWC41_00670 [Firmicutes bacterium]|nr:hypothetical protein [Bacillota bacterium]
MDLSKNKITKDANYKLNDNVSMLSTQNLDHLEEVFTKMKDLGDRVGGLSESERYFKEKSKQISNLLNAKKYYDNKDLQNSDIPENQKNSVVEMRIDFFSNHLYPVIERPQKTSKNMDIKNKISINETNWKNGVGEDAFQYIKYLNEYVNANNPTSERSQILSYLNKKNKKNGKILKNNKNDYSSDSYEDCDYHKKMKNIFDENLASFNVRFKDSIEKYKIKEDEEDKKDEEDEKDDDKLDPDSLTLEEEPQKGGIDAEWLDSKEKEKEKKEAEAKGVETEEDFIKFIESCKEDNIFCEGLNEKRKYLTKNLIMKDNIELLKTYSEKFKITNLKISIKEDILFFSNILEKQSENIKSLDGTIEESDPDDNKIYKKRKNICEKFYYGTVTVCLERVINDLVEFEKKESMKESMKAEKDREDEEREDERKFIFNLLLFASEQFKECKKKLKDLENIEKFDQEGKDEDEDDLDEKKFKNDENDKSSIVAKSNDILAKSPENVNTVSDKISDIEYFQEDSKRFFQCRTKLIYIYDYYENSNIDDNENLKKEIALFLMKTYFSEDIERRIPRIRRLMMLSKRAESLDKDFDTLIKEASSEIEKHVNNMSKKLDQSIFANFKAPLEKIEEIIEKRNFKDPKENEIIKYLDENNKDFIKILGKIKSVSKKIE